MLALHCYSALLICMVHMAQATANSELEIERHSLVKRESLDVGEVYDFFTDDVVAQKFFIITLMNVSILYNLRRL